MDFRSQLSAFQSGGGGGGNNNTPNRSLNNRYNNNSNYYGRGGRSDNYGDRRRSRPRDWNHNQGPPHSRRRHHSPDRDGLGDLRNFGYRIPREIPPPPTPEQKKRKTKHIALLAITIDDLPYEHIWKAWCQTLAPKKSDDYYISIVCHAKYPKKVQSEWLRQRLLVHPPKLGRGNSFLDPEHLTRTPEWGKVEITRAMLDLLQDAMKIGRDKQEDTRFSASRYLVRRPNLPSGVSEEQDDKIPPVDQFLYISETCLPVATAQDVFDTVKDTTVSWVNACHRNDEGTPKNLYENDQFAGINRRIKGQYRWKADQWILLCRNHASMILDIDRPHIPPKHQLWQSFRDINASDEMYFPTCLSVLGLLRFSADGQDTQRSRSNSQADSRGRSDSSADDPSGRNNHASGSVNSQENQQSSPPVHVVLKRPVTYTDWSEGMRNPASFTKGLSDFKRVAQLARKNGCLVARKFALSVAVPGVAKEDQKVTGQITVEEWQQEVKLLQEKYASANAPTSPEPEEKRKKEDGNGDKEAGKEQGENEKSSEGEEEEVEESFITSHVTKKVDDNDDDDQDQGETQLE